MPPEQALQFAGLVANRLNVFGDDLQQPAQIEGESLLVLTVSNVVHSSAVYRQHLCCDPARLWRGQEGYRIGDDARIVYQDRHRT